MERRDFLKLASISAMAAATNCDSANAQEATQEKPNIIFIVSDQHRAGLTKREGYALDTSPELDRLAGRGVAFDRAYCTSPLCVPSRISMLTGRWPEATRVRSNSMIQDAVYPTHLYKVAQENGYRTGLTGKNHTFLKESDLDFWRPYELANGWISPGAPKEYHDFTAWMQALRANIALEPNPFPVELQYPYRMISDAMEFIGDSGSQPFILQIGFSEPHDPEQVPAPYWDMFPPDSIPDRCAGPEALKQLGDRARWLYGHQEEGFPSEKNWRRYKSNYLGMLRLIDDQLARLTKFLDDKRLREKTIIVYLADHGDYLMDYGLGRKGVGLPECLVRIPMVWSGPGIKYSKVGAFVFVSMVDFMPTLCEAIGVEIPHGVQGRSLWPLLRGENYPSEEFRSIYTTVGLGGLYYDASDHVPFSVEGPQRQREEKLHPGTAGYDELNKVTQSGLQKMVRMGNWKLIFDMMGYGQLYDVKGDPCELNNLFNRPEVSQPQAELMAELFMWTIRAQDSLPTGPQGPKYKTKWPANHNWYAPYRHGQAPTAYIP